MPGDIKQIKADYITKEDFFREQAKTDRKLDRIMDILLEMKGIRRVSNLEKRALRAGSFVHNNGKVLRTVNILRLKYNKLTGVQSVLEDDGIARMSFWTV